MTTPVSRRMDFLDRVLERSSGALPTLQPRLPSLFEPAPWAAASPLDIEAEQDLATPIRQPIRRPRTAETAAMAELSGRAALVSHPRDRAEFGESRNVAAEAFEVPTLEVPQPPRPPVSTGETLIERTVGLLNPQMPSSIQHEIGRVVQPRALPPSSQPIAPGAEPAAVPAARSQPFVHEFALSPLRQPTTQFVVPERGTPIASLLLPELGNNTDAGEREPVVNVSIGRLEVRAPATAANTPKQAQKPRGVQPASLSAYMKQVRGKR